MHLADLDGRLYERRKQQRIHEMKFWAWWGIFLIAVFALLVS